LERLGIKGLASVLATSVVHYALAKFLPSSSRVAARVTTMATMLCGEPRTQRAVAEVARVSRVALGGASGELAERLGSS